jgi:hypothetical protein
MPRDVRDLKCGYVSITPNEEDELGPVRGSIWPTRDPREPDTAEDLRNTSKYQKPNYRSIWPTRDPREPEDRK